MARIPAGSSRMQQTELIRPFATGRSPIRRAKSYVSDFIPLRATRSSIVNSSPNRAGLSNSSAAETRGQPIW